MSKIKGGGRAQLTPGAEDSIISLLYDLRDHKNPLAPNKIITQFSEDGTIDRTERNETRNAYSDLSDHDKKKERKRFLKKLLKCHNRVLLSNKLNQTPISTPSVPHSNQNAKHNINDKDEIVNNSGKVRVELVEMVFKEKKKKKDEKKKSSKKDSKKEKKASWKEGTKKIIVLQRSTTIKNLKTQCKSKLNMKIPSRIFILDKDTNLEVDLEHDLRGLEDGAIVYATNHSPPARKKNPMNDDHGVSQEEEDEEIIIDPLENIKHIYRTCGHKKQKENAAKVPILNQPFPAFSDSISKLEPLSESRSKLPASKYRSDILSSLDSSRVIVIAGATGCGKSTQVPQFILEGMKAINHGEDANILVTQPRRVAAMALAKRVAEERNLPSPGRVGSEIGYNVRLAKAVSKEAKIVYCTVGVLLRMIVNPMESHGDENDGDNQSSVPLSSITTCIIDEVHERDLTTDFALTLLRPILAVNKRISIVLMSATASSSLFVNFFRSMDIEPKVFEIPGRTFPVETRWLKDSEKMVSGRMNEWSVDEDLDIDDEINRGNNNYFLSPRAKSKIDNDFIVKLILRIAQEQWDADKGKSSNENKVDGSILVFLPGKGEIEALARSLYKEPKTGNRSQCSILKLHSTLTPSEQWRAFQPVKSGVVKIVLSTNVAETSITIPDISVVIDTGRVKEMRFNASTRIKELVTVWTSQASSKQRAGRAGRTRPGTCYKLYTEGFVQSKMPRQTSPEIVRTPLEELILQVCLLEEQKSSQGTNPEAFLANAPESPPQSNVQQAISHLQEMGALTLVSSEGDDRFRLTPLGYHLSHLPMDTKVGKILVVGCILQCIEPALTIAATLSAPKSMWLSYIPGVENSREKARIIHENLIHNGFGGVSWAGGNVKGDAIGSIAVYDAWSACVTSSSGLHPDKQRRAFAAGNALDHNALNDIKGLRSQFKQALRSSGLLRASEVDNVHGKDALLTSCCLVAGLYPNIATLMRPSRKLRIRSGLITKDGATCIPSSNSFQCDRIRNASEGGKDAYAVYHGKHRTIGTSSSNDQRSKKEPFLDNINFVNRFAMLLFGGEIVVNKNCLIVDEWLKFKVDDADNSKSDKIPEKGHVNAVLINELRKELDNVLLKHIMKGGMIESEADTTEKECERVIQVVRQLLLSN